MYEMGNGHIGGSGTASTVLLTRTSPVQGQSTGSTTITIETGQTYSQPVLTGGETTTTTSSGVFVTNWPINAFDLLSNIENLKRKIGELETRLDELRFRPATQEIIEIKNVSAEEAESLVADYLEANRRGFPSDISVALGISLEATVEALEHLKEKGIVKPTSDSSP